MTHSEPFYTCYSLQVAVGSLCTAAVGRSGQLWMWGRGLLLAQVYVCMCVCVCACARARTRVLVRA